ncbi:hypothetical protein RJZ56_001076 [Blastomyces dermatitidis]|uniref:RGS domain-containing protein n=2 Tax=Blastomyces TaxID=229219 RepID=A0A179V1Y2_BLAGS|nr:uncharacterized protein BDBG_08564 [Blastomyces gilchristii SLH14081]XP_045278165.1 uncharacterized protein BDCG_06793 [Blastomyces dermatitidis ER-3]EEQ91673.2 hypothetical protein BDCG_06793 [Blastomyces dermatitidis ER-3]EQL31869.1 hypothetical protein BDFG_05914 [Blastomyces dermatitidis ATCC 26199]OAT13341.1 hypothetical protein BDBG_08564 [Blastomyces gilchristii SLH14081]
MACRILGRCCPPPNERLTNVRGAREPNKQSRVTKLPGAWRGQEGLSFDMIVGGCTCPPCTLRDFMNYLKYVERNAENLQFFLWYRDYSRRFALIADNQRQLSPEWIGKEKRPGDVSGQPTPTVPLSPAVTIVAEEQFESTHLPTYIHTAPFSTPPRSPAHPDGDRSTPSRTGKVDGTSSPRTQKSEQENLPGHVVENMDSINAGPAAAARTEASSETKCNDSHVGTGESQRKTKREQPDHPQKPNLSQPYRNELTRIYATYIADGASRQLNLTSQERDNLNRALASTTHPSAFKQVAGQVEWTLRQQSHPNFIRWTMNNCNCSRIIAARIVSCVAMFCGLIAGIIPILSSATRAWRIISALILLPGLVIFLTSWDGGCILFLFLNRRHLHPWELFSDEDEHVRQKLGMQSKIFSSVGESNSYEDEPWIPTYERRKFLQKVFDPDTRIQDPILRRIHLFILLRTLTVAAIVTAALLIIFLSIPKCNYF